MYPYSSRSNNGNGSLQAETGTKNYSKYLKTEMDSYPSSILGPARGFGNHIFQPTTMPYGLFKQPFFGGFRVTTNTTPIADQMQIVQKMVVDQRPEELGGDFSLTELAVFMDAQPANRDHDMALDLVTLNYILTLDEFQNVEKEYILKKFPFIGFGISTDWQAMEMGSGQRDFFGNFNILSYDFNGRANIRNPGWIGTLKPGFFLGFTLKKVNVSEFTYVLSKCTQLKSGHEEAWQFVPGFHPDETSILKSNKPNQIFLPVATVIRDSVIENQSVNYTNIINYHSGALLNVFVLSQSERFELMMNESQTNRF